MARDGGAGRAAREDRRQPLLDMLAADVGRHQRHALLLQEGRQLGDADGVDADGGGRKVARLEAALEAAREHTQVALGDIDTNRLGLDGGVRDPGG